MSMSSTLTRIRSLIERDQFLISNHARARMFQRNISTEDMRKMVVDGEVIEEYADDHPCPSYLILGFSEHIPFHLVVAECEDHARIITIYMPDEEKWINYKKRRL